jgi:hypothetical protein
MATSLGVIWLSSSAAAHAPFDSNARITVLEETIEASAIVGSGLTEILLKNSNVPPLVNTGVGRGTVLPLELADRLFSITASGQNLNATQIRVLSDGLESSFVVTFPRPQTETLQLETRFAKHLPASNVCALIITDDQNRMLGSHLVKLGSAITEFGLPQLAEVASAPIVASSPTAATALAHELTLNSPAAKTYTVLQAILLIPLVAAFACGGLWLGRKIFGREST